MKQKLPRKFFPIAFSFVMAGIMVTIMTGVITYLNVGFVPDFFSRWLSAGLMAYVVAVPVVNVAAPLARRITARFVDSPFQ